nr:GNAT family N-acetyltransferase [uncultured Desulfobulbus sp.]
MEIKKLDPLISDELLGIFIQGYNNPPWNDQWDIDKARVYLKAFIGDPCFIGYSAYQKELLIGACLGTRRYWWKGDEYYIHEIFIDKSHQRQGIGTSFMNQIQSDLLQKNIRTITLLTDRGTPADEFYEKNGFGSSDRLVFKYKNF